VRIVASNGGRGNACQRITPQATFRETVLAL
jgi:hypothetical protein